MPNPLFHSIASWALKKRITQIELFVKYPHETQQEVLFKLLNTAKRTEVGMKYEFDSIKNYVASMFLIWSYSKINSDFQIRCF